MDIYNFLRSSAVADYCRKINKTWNTCEKAIIISRSDCLLNQKHAAWQELIVSYPDMPAPLNFHGVEFDSIHNWLIKNIEYERRTYEQFKRPEVGTVYRHNKSDNIFSTVEKALSDVWDNWDRDEAPRITINRFSVDSSGCSTPYINATLDYDGSVYTLDSNNSTGENIGAYVLRDLFFVDIPAPFKRGDILLAKYRNCGGRQIFVLDRPIWKDPEFLKKAKQGVCDGTDLTVWGYFASDTGALYGDHTVDYDSFEYYRGMLENSERLLHYVSLFIQKKIDLPSLLNVQCKIVAEQHLKNDFLIDTHGAYIPEHLRAENRTIEDDRA